MEERKIRQLETSEDFERNTLQNTQMLSKAHPKTERVTLEDIFIYPELEEFDKNRESKGDVSAKEVIENVLDYKKIAIAGESQSGKTTLCKIMFRKLRKEGFVPVYINDEESKFKGKIENRINKSLKNQYKDIEVEDIDKEKIIPIVDDFHLAKKKGKHIQDLSSYPRSIITVDDVFALNIEDEELISSFTYFRLKEFKPTLRYELIKNWVTLSGKEHDNISPDNQIYKQVDRNLELIDDALGRTFGKGIMPAYPFFILSTIVYHDTFEVPLEEEVTSQGHCYQAFIYFYLRREGVKDTETYVNFLTEFAFYLYEKEKREVSSKEFDKFTEMYQEKYHLPVKKKTLLKKLIASGIVLKDSFNNYSFRYPYLYYFFVAKNLAENLEDDDIFQEIKSLVNNLHVNENAYIAIFLAHHSKSDKILREIEENVSNLFVDLDPATLDKDEVDFIDEQIDCIVEASLPHGDSSPEEKRYEELEHRDELEQSEYNNSDQGEENLEDSSNHGGELRRAVKTVEVIGRIIKNRAGSLEKSKLKNLFLKGVNNHLRLLTSLLEIIEKPDDREDIFALVREYLPEDIKHEESGIRKKELEDRIRTVFWNLNFLYIMIIIAKIIGSLGSDRLIEPIEEVCDEEDDPAKFLVKHGILMRYNKNLRVNNLAKRTNKKDFSKTAEKILKFLVAEHSSKHDITYKDRQKLEDKLGMEKKELLKGKFKD